jgi:hypothetical protein
MSRSNRRSCTRVASKREKSVELYDKKGVSRKKERTAIKYTSPGFRSVDACSISAAAVIFAERAARKHYGTSGYCRTCRQVACSTDGTFAEYSAFIGHAPRGPRNQTVGHNQSFVVHATWLTNQKQEPVLARPTVFSLACGGHWSG